MGFAFTLYLGGAPAPAWIVAAIEEASVTCSDQAPNGFQVTFNSALGSQGGDYALLAAPQLQAGQSLSIAASVNGAQEMLIDGYITHIELQPQSGGGEAQIVVTGEDVSVLMDFYEYSMEYPLMPDFAIAGTVLLKWLAVGLMPKVHPTPTSGLSFTNVPQQVGTDRKYLLELAGAHAYVFYIAPGSSPGDNTAYWGPPPRDAAVQPPLSVDQGGASAVSEISFSFDSLAPQCVWGAVLNTTTNLIIPVLVSESTRDGDFAQSSQLDDSPTVSGIPFVRTTLFDHQGLGVVTAIAKAQATVNLSSDAVATAKGRLDVLRHGRTLKAPGVVALRGAGFQFDGLYYVQKVKHSLSRSAWSQEFVLTREGLGSTLLSVDAV